MIRRQFLQKLGITSTLLAAGNFPLQAFGDPETLKLTILHTNDVHSRIEPFPMDGGRYEGQGGAARRAQLIAKIRQEEAHVLLLDSGDIFQGTPYFNYFGGELEFKLMSNMQYDAATIGNHDFDAGIDGLHKQLPHANFPLVVSNYDFEDTILHQSTEPFITLKRGPLKIGILGLGIELKGLVPQQLFGNTRYLDPIAQANKVAERLKQGKNCDVVICLSHLGYQYREDRVSDVVLAKNSSNIDLILGGHTHTFMNKPALVANKNGQPVYINQVGWGGLVLGRIDLFFERNGKNKCIGCKNLPITA